jgi:phage N-6-adenine-methyltransferase
MSQLDLNGNRIEASDLIESKTKKGKAVNHMKIITDNDEWSTPRELLLNKLKHFLMDGLDLTDYASSYINHKFERYFDVNDNSLSLEWIWDGFLNPPYSQVEEFILHVIKQWKKHGKAFLILVFAKVDTDWYQDHIEPMRKTGEIIVEFQRHRIDFDEVDEVANVVWSAKHKVWAVKYYKDKEGYISWKVTNSAPYPNMWIYLPPKQNKLT